MRYADRARDIWQKQEKLGYSLAPKALKKHVYEAIGDIIHYRREVDRTRSEYDRLWVHGYDYFFDAARVPQAKAAMLLAQELLDQSRIRLAMLVKPPKHGTKGKRP